MRNPWRLREGPERLVSSPFALPQRISLRALYRPPGRPLPGGARRARGRVLHPAHVERRPPAPLVVTRELDVVASVQHAPLDDPDSVPRVQPAVESMEDRRELTLETKEPQRG